MFVENIIKNSKSINKFDKMDNGMQKIKRIFSFKNEKYLHKLNINPYIFINELSKQITANSGRSILRWWIGI